MDTTVRGRQNNKFKMINLHKNYSYLLSYKYLKE